MMNSLQEAKQEERIPIDMGVLDHQEMHDAEQKREHKAKISNHHDYLRELKKTGHCLRSDKDQPKILEKPSWFNEELFKNAQSVYARHFMGVNFAHLSGLLILVRVDSIYRTLSVTGQSSSVAKLFRRYYNTLKHVKAWYEGDMFDGQNEAYRSLLIVRGMHNKVAVKFNDKTTINATKNGKDKLSGEANELANSPVEEQNCIYSGHLNGNTKAMVHISEYDIMITQFAFIGFIVLNGKNMGLLDDFDARDLESLLHFWRVIGYYLGASEKFNLCAYELGDIMGLCEAFKDIEYKDSISKNPLTEPPGIMSLNIIRSVKFIPMLTIYGMMRYLYELLGQEITEVEHKKNWYSSLSYTFIKLVMNRILAYRPMRSFNNGITRLSVFLVGHIEDWFAGRLEANYGQGLKF